jgi:hypothetical protein
MLLLLLLEGAIRDELLGAGDAGILGIGIDEDLNNGSGFTVDDVINDCNIDWLFTGVAVEVFAKNGLAFEDVDKRVVVTGVTVDKVGNNGVDYVGFDNNGFIADLLDYYYFYEVFLTVYTFVGNCAFSTI